MQNVMRSAFSYQDAYLPCLPSGITDPKPQSIEGTAGDNIIMALNARHYKSADDEPLLSSWVVSSVDRIPNQA